MGKGEGERGKGNTQSIFRCEVTTKPKTSKTVMLSVKHFSNIRWVLGFEGTPCIIRVISGE